MKYKISIIVPVYGVEEYVGKCLESLLKQDMPSSDYEIIVINDGTRDNSWEVVKRVTTNHPNVKLFEQQNQGLSATRNHGFDYAEGEYIWCVDSDDYIEENCLNKLYNKVRGHDLLIQTCYIPTGLNTEKRTQFDAKYNVNATRGKELLLTGFLSPAQFYIYRADWLKKNGLRFYQGVYHEDMEFTPRALFLAESIVFQTEPVYYFYKRPGSITTQFNPKRLADVLKLSRSLNDFYKSHKDKPNAKNILIHSCKCIIYGVIQSANLESHERLNYIKMIAKDAQLMDSLLKVDVKKYNVQYILMKVCPWLYINIFDKLYSKKYN